MTAPVDFARDALMNAGNIPEQTAVPTHADWFRWTSNADAARKAAHRVFLTAEYPPSDATIARRRAAEQEYECAIMLAWHAYRPSGPLDGEVLPTEVERINAKEGTP